MKKRNSKTRRGARVIKVELKKAVIQHAASSSVAIEKVTIKPEETSTLNENLLEKCRSQWQSGEWESLVALDRNIIEHHANRDKLVLIIASAWQQLNNNAEARYFIKLAQEWGCDKKLIAAVLIASVHNTLGRVAALVGDDKRIAYHFRNSVTVASRESQADLIGHARSVHEIARLGLLKQEVSHLEENQQRKIYWEGFSKPVVRTIHHFSCTGGTLFSKCLAAQPNVVMLNEVNPFTKMALNNVDKPNFAPRDIISLLHQSGKTFDNRFIADIFCSDIKLIVNELSKTQKALILREHSHSIYLFGASIDNPLLVDESLKDHFDIKSIITVRNPIDSYLSLKKNGWVAFQPPTFDEYCFRYLRFLDDYKYLKIFKYEDFVENSMDIMMKICRELDIEFNADFINHFSEYKFSGDSGRSGNVIEPRTRHSYTQDFVKEVNNSENFKKLALILCYNNQLI